ncbi:MAG: hypothetical protein ACREDT_04480 [Methylocella sp.]
MAARDGIAGTNGGAKARAVSRKALLFGLSVLAAVAFFDATPAAAQYLGLGPFSLYLGGGGHYRRGHSHYRYRRYARHHASYHYGHRHHGGGHRHHGGGGGAPVPQI